MSYHPALLLAAVLWLPAGNAYADTRIATWNIEHLGWDNGKHMTAVARVAGAFDFLAV